MDSGVLDATLLPSLVLEVLETVGLIPTRWEDIEGNLSTDGVAISCVSMEMGKQRVEDDLRETIISKLILQSLHEGLANLVLLIKPLILVSLADTSIPSDRRDIDHAIPVLNKSTSLNRDIQIGNIVKNELDELLVSILANIVDEGVGSEWLTKLIGGQSVLGEAEVKEGCDVDSRGADLLLLLGKVGTADETDGDFVSELGKERKHLRGDGLYQSLAFASKNFW